MAKPKKQTRRLKLSPENFERNLMIVLLICVMVSTLVLVIRTNRQNNAAELNEPVTITEGSE